MSRLTDISGYPLCYGPSVERWLHQEKKMWNSPSHIVHELVRILEWYVWWKRKNKESRPFWGYLDTTGNNDMHWGYSVRMALAWGGEIVSSYGMLHATNHRHMELMVGLGRNYDHVRTPSRGMHNISARTITCLQVKQGFVDWSRMYRIGVCRYPARRYLLIRRREDA